MFPYTSAMRGMRRKNTKATSDENYPRIPLASVFVVVFRSVLGATQHNTIRHDANATLKEAGPVEKVDCAVVGSGIRFVLT